MGDGAMADGLEIQGFEDALARVGRCAPQLGYLRLHPFELGGDREALGRFDWDEQEARQWVQDDEEGGALLLVGCTAWLRATLANHMLGAHKRTFRLHLYGPKGTRHLGSVMLRATNPEEQDEEPPLDVQSQRYAPQLAPTPPSASAQVELRTGYTLERMLDNSVRMSDVALNHYERMAAVHERELAACREQILQKDQLIESLTQRLVEKELRLAEISSGSWQLEAERQASREVVQPLIELAGRGLDTWALTRGAPTDVLSLQPLLADPTIAGVLKDPRFQAVVSDPDGRAFLGKMITKVVESVDPAATQQGATRE